MQAVSASPKPLPKTPHDRAANVGHRLEGLGYLVAHLMDHDLQPDEPSLRCLEAWRGEVLREADRLGGAIAELRREARLRKAGMR